MWDRRRRRLPDTVQMVNKCVVFAVKVYFMARYFCKHGFCFNLKVLRDIARMVGLYITEISNIDSVNFTPEGNTNKNKWMNEWMNEWINEWRKEGRNEGMEWVCEYYCWSEWVCECEWVHWALGIVSDWMTKWASEWVSVNEYDNMKWNESGFRPLLCTYRLNWTRRTSWGWWDEWDDTARQTQDSKFKPWRSETEHATSRSRRLPTILSFRSGWERNIFVFFQAAETGKRTRNCSVKGNGANHYPRAPARMSMAGDISFAVFKCCATVIESSPLKG